MDKYIQIELKLYGALSEYKQPSAPLRVLVESGIKVEHLRQSVIHALKDKHPGFEQEAVVQSSAFAIATNILADDECLYDDCQLSILPPVCGG